MNKSIEFKNIKELYDRVKPALYSKVKELRGLEYKNIHEEDIWNYLVESNWKKKHDLQLCDLISDILFTNNLEINNYVTNFIKSKLTAFSHKYFMTIC